MKDDSDKIVQSPGQIVDHLRVTAVPTYKKGDVLLCTTPLLSQTPCVLRFTFFTPQVSNKVVYSSSFAYKYAQCLYYKS